MFKLFKNIKLRKVAKHYNVNIHAERGLSINGLLVKDFDYLLTWYSNNKLNSFNDRSLLFTHHKFILNEIDRDFDNDKLKEEISYPITITRKIAETKLRQLKNIILALVRYYQVEK